MTKDESTLAHHEPAVPGFYLLFGKVGVLHEEVHVFLGQLLATAGTHRGGGGWSGTWLVT